MSQDRVTINDVRAAGHCVRGARSWFEARGLDFRRFLREGLTVEEIRALGDGLADQVLERKRGRE